MTAEKDKIIEEAKKIYLIEGIKYLNDNLKYPVRSKVSFRKGEDFKELKVVYSEDEVEKAFSKQKLIAKQEFKDAIEKVAKIDGCFWEEELLKAIEEK